MTENRRCSGVASSAALATALLLPLMGCGERSSGESAEIAATARPVSVALARKTPLRSTLTLSGEFKPFQEVDLHAKVAGYIRTISVDVGDRVRAGQVLAVLEIPELVAQVQEADASLERARSEHAAAHSGYARLKQASESRPGLIAAQELEDALARDKAAEAHVAQTEAGQRQVSALSDYSRITAPFSGVITKRYADTGALIQAGTSSSTQAMPVVRLAEFDRLRLVLPVPESAVPRIHVGTVVQVVVPALARTFEGRVARLSDDLDRQTRTMETEIDVANPDDSLVAGMYAETVLDLVRRGLHVDGSHSGRFAHRHRGHGLRRRKGEPHRAAAGHDRDGGTRRLEILHGPRRGRPRRPREPRRDARRRSGRAEGDRGGWRGPGGGALMSRFAIKHPYFIIVLALIVALLGTTTLVRMPVDLFPSINIPVVVVATFYSGMPPEQIETSITGRFERFFTLGSDIDHIESRSLPGVSLIKIYFHPGSDPNAALSQISNLALANLRKLPPPARFRRSS